MAYFVPHDREVAEHMIERALIAAQRHYWRRDSIRARFGSKSPNYRRFAFYLWDIGLGIEVRVPRCLPSRPSARYPARGDTVISDRHEMDRLIQKLRSLPYPSGAA